MVGHVESPADHFVLFVKGKLLHLGLYRLTEVHVRARLVKGWHLVIDQIYVTHLLHYVWLGDGKWGREKWGEKRFFCCFVERGKGGGFWWGLDVLSLGLPKKIPQIGQKKGRKRGVSVK